MDYRIAAIGVVVVIVIIIIVYYVYFYEGLTTSIPNFNYDSGAGTRIRSQVWTQPQMVGYVGDGDNPPRKAEGLVYTKYKNGDFIKNTYDYGNMFHIPTSVTDNSDTTEDGLLAMTIERSRYAKNGKANSH